MSMWNMDLEGFAPQWLDVADRFENGQESLIMAVASRKAAETMRFEWYAFKRKMRKMEESRSPEDRMYPTLPRVRAEIGTLANGQWAMRLSLRDISQTAKLLEEALARPVEEAEEIYKEFTSIRKGE